MKEKGIEPKLRSYNPALQAHCEKKQLAEARPRSLLAPQGGE